MIDPKSAKPTVNEYLDSCVDVLHKKRGSRFREAEKRFRELGDEVEKAEGLGDLYVVMTSAKNLGRQCGIEPPSTFILLQDYLTKVKLRLLREEY